MNKKLLRIQASLTRIEIAKRLIMEAYPEIIGNQPEYAHDLIELQKKLNWLIDTTEKVFEKVASDTP